MSCCLRSKMRLADRRSRCLPRSKASRIAAASIAQVHRAKLPSGAAVVLKIRRHGISAKIDADLRLLEHLANLIEHEMPEARRYAPVQVVAQFRRSLERELDLAVEARHIDRFARNFADDANILVPKVYWDFTSSSMNVQEYVAGTRGPTCLPSPPPTSTASYFRHAVVMPCSG